LVKLGRKAANSMIADKPILSDAVAAAPISGKRPFAIAAPHCTLIIDNKTAGTGGRFILIFMQLGDDHKTTYSEPRKYINIKAKEARNFPGPL